MKILCRIGIHNWKFEDGRYTRICKSCEKKQITIGVIGNHRCDYWETSTKGKYETERDVEDETKANKKAAGWGQDALEFLAELREKYNG